MTRWDLITSDEWITASVDCIVASRKSIKKIRDELNDFFIKHRNELLHGNQGSGCVNKNCKICYPYKNFTKKDKQEKEK